MKLWIIRHGQSEADILNVHEGRADFPLTDLGKRQAQAMAEWVVSQDKPARIYSSPLKRADQTAQALQKACGPAANLLYIEELMEFNNGLLAGLSREEANEKYPRLEKVYLHTETYGQESVIQFRARAEKALSFILSQTGEEETVAVIAHGGMIGQLYHSFLRLPIGADLGFSTGDTGVHLWEVQGNRRMVRFANSTFHTAALEGGV